MFVRLMILTTVITYMLNTTLFRHRLKWLASGNASWRMETDTIWDIQEQAIFAGEAAREPGHSNPYEYFCYFKAEVNGQTIRINVGKKVQIKSNGQISVKYICYSENNI